MEWLGEDVFELTMTCSRYRLLSFIPGQYMNNKKEDNHQRTKVEILFNPAIAVGSVDEVK